MRDLRALPPARPLALVAAVRARRWPTSHRRQPAADRPGLGLGIPMQNQFKLWPKQIAGEKLNLIILDDATDPAKGVRTRAASSPRTRSTSSSARPPRRWRRRWPTSVAEGKTVQLSFSPVGAAAGQGRLDVPPAAVQRGDGARR